MHGPSQEVIERYALGLTSPEETRQVESWFDDPANDASALFAVARSTAEILICTEKVAVPPAPVVESWGEWLARKVEELFDSFPSFSLQTGLPLAAAALAAVLVVVKSLPDPQLPRPDVVVMAANVGEARSFGVQPSAPDGVRTVKDGSGLEFVLGGYLPDGWRAVVVLDGEVIEDVDLEDRAGKLVVSSEFGTRVKVDTARPNPHRLELRVVADRTGQEEVLRTLDLHWE
jgi:hypothetical protein